MVPDTFIRLRKIARRWLGGRIHPAVRQTWKPSDCSRNVLLRWCATHWCNYSCPYCRQQHSRDAKSDGRQTHCFDNRPVDDWIRGFEFHFGRSRLSLVVTGGEPLMDHQSMTKLLNSLTEMTSVDCIRMDTNASLAIRHWESIDPRKIILMCTFHPTQTTEESFKEKIDGLLSMGFTIGMINYVMTSESIPTFEERCRHFAKKGVPLHPNPLWDSNGRYSEADILCFKNYLPKCDYLYRSGIRSTLGRLCLFPAIGYEMDQGGTVRVGCHHGRSGSFFDERLPQLFADAVPCPRNNCACLDKYSFLAGESRNQSLNPLKDYHNALMEIRNRQCRTSVER